MNEGNVVADFDSDLLETEVMQIWKSLPYQAVVRCKELTHVWPTLAATRSEILGNTGLFSKRNLTFNGIGHLSRGQRSRCPARKPCLMLSGSSAFRCQSDPLDWWKMTSRQAMLHRSVKWTQKIWLPMSRSDQHTAERLVVRGFLGSVTVEIPVKEVRDEMIATIEEKLSQR